MPWLPGRAIKGGMKGGSILKVKGFFYHSLNSRLGFWTFFTILRSKGWFRTGFNLKVYIIRLFLLQHKYFDIFTRKKPISSVSITIPNLLKAVKLKMFLLLTTDINEVENLGARVGAVWELSYGDARIWAPRADPIFHFSLRHRLSFGFDWRSIPFECHLLSQLVHSERTRRPPPWPKPWRPVRPGVRPSWHPIQQGPPGQAAVSAGCSIHQQRWGKRTNSSYIMQPHELRHHHRRSYRPGGCYGSEDRLYPHPAPPAAT